MEINLLWAILVLNLASLIIVCFKIFIKDRLGQPSNVTIIDTSGLIDGRILDIARAGFMSSKLVIPKCVVLELQNLADKSDKLKRERARFGLSVIQELQELNNIKLELINYNSGGDVDDQLVKIALKMGASIYSTDFNLQQVAQIAGVTVLNVNQLIQALRPAALPGEKLKIKLVQKGEEKNKNQAVGFLPDGTMVVVAQAKGCIGKTVTVKTTKVIQTVSGRMIFANLGD